MWNANIRPYHQIRRFLNFEEEAKIYSYQKDKYASTKELRYHRDISETVCLSLEMRGIQQTVKVLNDRLGRTKTI